ncbi:hypothetical protein DRE_04493 [Drechslerella stenobrocha 248]|uniref:Peptidase A1 domain-containing protein n=1 Tax=Drechslerella stenobrocha 248 TaxID=1043628 RepID=W7I1C0_9PEZI|nr:hypothetical protein DRE_04493 [Drechslerella stenobrocha 248]
MRGSIALAIGSVAAAAVAAQEPTPDVAIAQFGQTWYGPDGPWAAAEVEIGTPGQKVYLTVATLQDTLLPITPDACGGVQDCILGRGYAYNETSSSTWRPASNRNIDLGADMSAGVVVNGQAYGIEVRGVPGADTASIGGVPGILGVSTGAIKNSRINNGLLGLRNITNQMYLQRLIPSPSWAYNTGSGDGYRLPQLVFGGYDRTKYLPGSMQNHSMEVTSNGRPTMRVALDRLFLNMTGPENRGAFATNSSLLDSPINVIIDSSTPFCWLPRDITDRIAQSVGAVWNATIGGSGYYIYNSSAPAYRNLLNSTLAFHVNGTGDSWLFNSISVSHMLSLAAPTAGVLPNSPLAYLPLMPVDNPSNYVLGRSFLQQIYLIANYHTMEFSLSQVNLDAPSAAQYVKIDAPVPPPLPPNEPPKSRRLSGGAIAGIVIGSITAVALIIAAVLWYTRRRQKDNRPVPTPPEADKLHKMDGVYYREMSADTLGVYNRETTPMELYAPVRPFLPSSPVEAPADNYSSQRPGHELP